MTYSHRRRVEFRDTDAAGIVHFSVFFPMMEEAEHAALRSVGLSVMEPDASGGHWTWPRVAATCDYITAARFEDRLRIEVSVVKIGTTSVTYAFHFFRDDPIADAAADLALRPLASGTLTAVCCHFAADRSLQKRPIPPDVRERLLRLAAPASLDRP